MELQPNYEFEALFNSMVENEKYSTKLKTWYVLYMNGVRVQTAMDKLKNIASNFMVREDSFTSILEVAHLPSDFRRFLPWYGNYWDRDLQDNPFVYRHAVHKALHQPHISAAQFAIPGNQKFFANYWNCWMDHWFVKLFCNPFFEVMVVPIYGAGIFSRPISYDLTNEIDYVLAYSDHDTIADTINGILEPVTEEELQRLNALKHPSLYTHNEISETAGKWSPVQYSAIIIGPLSLINSRGDDSPYFLTYTDENIRNLEDRYTLMQSKNVYGGMDNRINKVGGTLVTIPQYDSNNVLTRHTYTTRSRKLKIRRITLDGPDGNGHQVFIDYNESNVVMN